MQKIMIYILGFILFMQGGHPVWAENYLLNGGQKSTFRYALVQEIRPTGETVTMNLTYVIPQTFTSETYRQQIKDFDIRFSLKPDARKEWTDRHGNRVVDYAWDSPKKAFKAEVSFISDNEVTLKQIKTESPFPVNDLPAAFDLYLSETAQVQVNNKEIKQKARALVNDSKTEFDAVQRILTWVIDKMKYVLTPEAYDAMYAFRTGKGNCQNYSHLAAALMRAVGIPVRIVNGITLKEPYHVKLGAQLLSLNMAQGRHSWIEVYFPDLGWMPFDPQQTELFVSNRFVRIEIGLDNQDTMNDGLVRWTRTKGSKEVISFQETIAADFTSDIVDLIGEKQGYGPKNLMLLPPVKAQYFNAPVVKEQKPVPYDPALLAKAVFEKPYIYGNLDFPEGVNFAFSRTTRVTDNENSMEKNFLVETAEYITGGQDYCQAFEIGVPVNLQQIGVALQKFGGEGELVLELRENTQGGPGKIAAVSRGVRLENISGARGYFWVDFDFADQQLMLTPDRYWISINYKGSPIINWFYSYGKPVGQMDGTRSKSRNEANWRFTMGYEFNYRVSGLTIR